MSFTQKLTRWSMMMMGALLLSVGLAACGGGGGGGGASVAEDTVPATITVGSSYAAPAPISGFVTRGNVDSADIDSIIVEITKVTVHRAGGDDVVEENEGDSEPLDPDTEEAAGTGGWLTLFEANTPEENIVLDLVDLQLISEVLTSVNLPVGKYTKIALYYENPVVTVDGVETTDVQTTANGRIFISQNFIVPDTGPVLIQIDFKEIGLTEAGNSGKYVLNPQLRVNISIESALVEFAGTILSITPEPPSISVDSGTTILDVAVNEGTEIVRQQEVAPPVEEEPPALADFVEIEVPFGDLMIGDKVEVDGVLQLDGTIEADRIEVVPPLLLPVEPEVPEEPTI